jgi:hypothetical protein
MFKGKAHVRHQRELRNARVMLVGIPVLFRVLLEQIGRLLVHGGEFDSCERPGRRAMLSHLHQHSGASIGRLIAPREESLAGARDGIVAGRAKRQESGGMLQGNAKTRSAYSSSEPTAEAWVTTLPVLR